MGMCLPSFCAKSRESCMKRAAQCPSFICLEDAQKYEGEGGDSVGRVVRRRSANLDRAGQTVIQFY